MAGFFENSSTTEVDMAPKSAAELGLEGMAVDMMIAAAEKVGYVILKTSDKTWDQTDKGKRLKTDADNNLRALMELVGYDYNDPRHRERFDYDFKDEHGWPKPEKIDYYRRYGQYGGELYDVEGNTKELAGNFKRSVEQQRDYEREYADSPIKDYTFRKKYSEKAEAVGREYGFESEEYKAAVTEEVNKVIEKEEEEDLVEKKTREIMIKLLDGDFAPTEVMKEEIRRRNAPIRTALNKAFDDLDAGIVKEEYAALSRIEQIQATLSDMIDTVEKSGMSTMGAFDAIANQIDKTDVSLNDALTNVVSVQNEMLRLGVEIYSEDLIRNVSERVARTGRSPMDAEYQKEIRLNVSREITQGQLSIADMEAKGRLGIAQETGAKREALEREILTRGFDIQDLSNERRLNLMGRTGDLRLQTTQGFGEQRLAALTGRGQADVGFAESIAGQELEAGTYGVLGGYGATVGSSGAWSDMQKARQQAGAQLLGSLGQGFSGLADRYQKERMGGASQTTTDTPSTFGTITGGVGAAASAFGQIYGATAGGGKPSPGGGGGGGGRWVWSPE